MSWIDAAVSPLGWQCATIILVEFASIAGFKMSLGTAIAWLTVPIDAKFRNVGSFFVFNPTT